MFSIFSRAMNTATRLNTWDAPDQWRRQHEDYRMRCCREDAERSRLRATLKRTGLE